MLRCVIVGYRLAAGTVLPWWLMDTRSGGDHAARERLLTGHLYPVRDTVLDKAGLQPGDTVLDVGNSCRQAALPISPRAWAEFLPSAQVIQPAVEQCVECNGLRPGG